MYANYSLNIVKTIELENFQLKSSSEKIVEGGEERKENKIKKEIWKKNWLPPVVVVANLPPQNR